jgi:hypothetical protein
VALECSERTRPSRSISIGDIAADSGHVYWTNVAANEGIGRANLDGTGVDPSFITSAGSPRGVAVDAKHVYWTMSYTDAVSGCCGNATASANLDGSAVDQRLIDTGVGLKPPAWCDLEADGSHLYWTVSESNLSINEIVRANLDGTGGMTLIPDGARTIAGLAVDGLTDTKLAGKASAAKSQRQTGKRIVVKVRVKAKERLSAKASGTIKVSPTYKLKPKRVKLAAGESKTLRMKSKKAKAKKIARALKRGEKARAKLAVKLADLAGNTETEKLRVMLQR